MIEKLFVSEEHRFPEHTREVISGCLLTLHVLQCNRIELALPAKELRIGVELSTFRDYISSLCSNYFYVCHFHLIGKAERTPAFTVNSNLIYEDHVHGSKEPTDDGIGTKVEFIL